MACLIIIMIEIYYLVYEYNFLPYDSIYRKAVY